MNHHLLVIGDVTPEQLSKITSEYLTEGAEPPVTNATFKEFFLGTDGLVIKHDPETWNMVLAAEDGEEVPEPNSSELARTHIASFGDSITVVVLDEYSWIHGKDKGFPVWEQLMPPNLWVAYRDGSTCPIVTTPALQA